VERALHPPQALAQQARSVHKKQLSFQVPFALIANKKCTLTVTAAPLQTRRSTQIKFAEISVIYQDLPGRRAHFTQ
jgi:hypothetical protein